VDIIKRAMIAVDDWLLSEKPRVRMIMQVHDELVFEVVANLQKRALQIAHLVRLIPVFTATDFHQ
jgi:DNA polymerase I-like protein with 3'-5' exonuclease and polymerase domains